MDGFAIGRGDLLGLLAARDAHGKIVLRHEASIVSLFHPGDKARRPTHLGSTPHQPGRGHGNGTTAQFGDINEITDGRVPWRPVRHHFGIASFGINVFTGREAGDRIINEHDETDDGNEELYLVHSGRARFELDGETVDAPAGTLVFAKPEAKRTAFAEEPNKVSSPWAACPGRCTRRTAGRSGRRSSRSIRRGSTSRSPTASSPNA